MRRKKTPGFDYSRLSDLTSLDELRAARDEVAEHSEDLLSRSDDGDDTVTADDISEATEAIRSLDDRIVKTEARIAAWRDKAERDPETVRHDDERRSADIGYTPKRKRRDTGVSEAIERAVDAGLVTEDAATRIERAAASSESMSAYIRSTGEDYESAFVKVVGSERGHLTLTDAERRAYQSAQEENRGLLESNTGSSLIVPWALDPAIQLSSGGSVNPLRQISRSVTTSTAAWRGVTSAGVTAQWTAEAQEVGDNSPTLAAPTIPVHKATAYVPFSYELEQDQGATIPELQRLLLDGIEQLEAQAFVTGSGVGQPKGLITALAAASPSVIVNGAGSEVLAAGDPYRVAEALPPRFRPGAQWALNLSIINALRQFETGNGSKSFPELTDGKLLGKPVNEVSTLDGTINAAASETNFVAVYGDFSQFVIVNRLGAVVELVPQVFGPNGRPTGQRGLLLHVRTGSDALVPNAFRVLNVPTTA
ncbi:phage major capsid protein [Rhodococcus kroppenstedtii]|uniref:phage major capsid protein n=1 Tax=Rhodococcoides kroppenstedtii TaxID=293050 RepID=UPI002953C375|nr:phage major capsid protein [Rhodococcus kroppenstedtii]MDV7196908.1 phage major capsid protein [Rhodococcus kroppenstedtii]